MSESNANAASSADAAPQPCELLVRGRYVIVDAHADVIEHGAVCCDGDRIVAVGRYDDLIRRFRAQRELGSAQHIVLPGLINAHDHGRGPSALQLGIADDALEVWMLDLLRLPVLDPYLTTLLACAEQIEAGITTVAHSFYAGAGSYAATADATARAYQHSGLRARLVLGMLDESGITAQINALLPQLPAALQAATKTFLVQRSALSSDEYFEALTAWDGTAPDARVQAMLGPVSVHWCSEPLLLRLWQEAATRGWMLQTHLLESPQQRRAAQARYGRSAVQYLADLDLLVPQLSCAHCVQIDARDCELLAAHGVSVVHNPGSNLRLGNGIAPLTMMLQHGVNVALGLDSQALNDDGDLLQEMRLAALLARSAGADGIAPNARQMLALATRNGARALGIESAVGTLALGKQADLITIDPTRLQMADISVPLDVRDLLLQRGKMGDVDSVIVAGQLLYNAGRHTTIDKAELQREIAAQLRHAGAHSKLSALIAQLLPYLRRHIANS